MTNRKSTTGFPTSYRAYPIDRVRTLPLATSPKGGSKSDFLFLFSIKSNFNRIKTATKFFCLIAQNQKHDICEYIVKQKCARTQRSKTHAFKLYKRKCLHRSRAVFFSERVINIWNQLPESTDFRSLSSFMHSVCYMDLSRYLHI